MNFFKVKESAKEYIQKYRNFSEGRNNSYQATVNAFIYEYGYFTGVERQIGVIDEDFEANDLKELIKKIERMPLFSTTPSKDWDFKPMTYANFEGASEVSFSVVVDENYLPATKEQKSQWKKFNKELYLAKGGIFFTKTGESSDVEFVPIEEFKKLGYLR